MYRIKNKIMALGLALIMCTSMLVAAFLPEKTVTNSVSAGNDKGLSLTEDKSMKQADTSSAFDKTLVNINEEVTGEHWLIVSLDGESLSDRNNSSVLREYAASASGKKAEQALLDEQEDFLADLRGAGIPYEYKYGFTLLTNAVAIKTDVKYADRIAEMDNVSSVDISEYYYAPKDSAVSNNANVWGTGIYNSQFAIDKGYNGAGMVVAILDTGLDASHEVFQKMPENKDLLLTKEEVQSLVFEGEEAQKSGVLSLDPNVTVDDVYYSEKVPFAYDYAEKDADVYPSNSSHGTHVAGIIAGTPLDEYITDQDGNYILDKDGNPMKFTGVAPEAQIVICKVFPDEEDENSTVGGAEEMDILAALEDCVKLGVDVVNMSLGSSAGFSTGDSDYMQEVYDSVREAGISLVVAASNDYSSNYGGQYGTNLATNPDSATVGSPSTYPSALSVASINGQQSTYIRTPVNGEDKFLYFTEASDGNGNEKDFVKELMTNNPDLVQDGTLTVEYQVVPGYGTSVNYSRINVRGKIAVVSRGGNVSFEDKVRTAMQKGAIGCVIYNNVSGIIRMSLGNLSNPIPTCSVTMDAASNIVKAGSGTMYISESQKAGPFMSDFSSWGPTPELKLKPEISAHGGEITSSVANGWAEYSGTSMAAPNMAGAMSLIISYVKKDLSSFVEEGNLNKDAIALSNFLVMSTATIARDEYDKPYSPRKQGAGLADITKMLTTKAYLYSEGIDKAKIEIGDDPDKTGVYELTFHAKNMSDSVRTYTLGTQTMTETIASDNLTVAERAYMLDEMADISFSGSGVSGNTLTLGANADVVITVTIKLHEEAKKYIDTNFINGMFVEGFVTLKDVTGDESAVDLNIPWLGFYGDWYASPMFDISEYELDAALSDDSIPDDEKPEAIIYPTVPLGSYWNETYVIPLGTYLYTQDPNARQIYSTSDKASISIYDEDGHRAVNQLYGVYAGLLRGAAEMKVSITDAVTGEKVFEQTQKNIRKSYTGGSSSAYASFIELNWSAAELGLENNRQYLFHMEGILASMDGRPYDPSLYDYGKSFDFNFYVDSQAPEIVDYRVRYEPYKDENEKTQYNVYLDVDVYDNHYAQSIALCFADYKTMSLEMLNSNLTPVYSTRNSVTTVTLDITDYYDQDVDLYLQVDDYALNARVYHVSNFKPLEDAVTYPDSVDIVSGTDADSEDYSKEIEIGVNEAVTLETLVSPSGSSSVNLYWHSFDEDVVIVKDGEIYGVNPGSAVVKVYAGKDEYAEASDGILVTVTDKGTSAPGITGLELGLIQNKDSNYVDPTDALVEVNQNEAFRLKVTVKPWYSEVEPVMVWESSVPQVASVDESTGYVRTLSEGTAVITGTLYQNGRPTLYSVSTTLSVGPEFVVENGYLREYHGAGGKVTIPKDLNVYYIYEKAFQDNANITELEISSPCTEIQTFAFANMKALKRIVFPDTVEYVHSYAFHGCENLERIDLHSRSITFATMSFANCTSLKYINNVELHLAPGVEAEDVEILDLQEGTADANGNYFVRIAPNMTSIGAQAFANCISLESLDLRELRVAGKAAFYNCKNLKEVTLSRYTALGDDMFHGCSSLSKLIYTDVTPEEIELITYDKVISPFGGCNITTIEFRNGSAVIEYTDGVMAIYADQEKTKLLKVGQNAKSFTVPASVQTIAVNAFAGNTNLTSVTFAEGGALKEIGAYAFSGTGLTSVKLPAGIEKLGKGVFSWCENLKQADLSLYEGAISESAFAESGLTRVTFGAGNTSVGAQAFMHTALTAVDMRPSSITSLGNAAFANCPNLKTVYMGSIGEMGSGVFAAYGNASLVTVVFSEGSTALGTNTFSGQSLLKNLTLSSEQQAIREIGAGVFKGCELLTSLPFKPVEVGASAFEGCTSLETLDLSLLETAGNAAFKNCKVLSAGQLPQLVSLGAEAFYGCALVKNVVMPNVTSVGDRAFEKSGLNKIEYPLVETIGKYAFANTALAGENGKLVIPASVKSIGEGAYSGLQTVTEFEIDTNETYFAESGMIYVRVANGVQVIAYPAGRGGDVVLNESTVRVGASAFENATKVTSVTFPYVFKAIGDKAFFNCGAVKYTFDCLSAPVLESQRLYAEDFEKGSDMYLILDKSGNIYSEVYYANFKDYVAKKLYAGKDGVTGIKDFGLTLVCHDNATGFTGYIYASYFSKVEYSGFAADDTSRNALALIEKIPSAEQVLALTEGQKDLWTEYRASVTAARNAYNLVTTIQSPFVTNSAKLYETEAAMREKAPLFGETVTRERISISTNPTKMTYVRGEVFDPSGMVLTLVWSDGSRESISSGYQVENKGTPLSLTDRTRVITYEGLKTQLNVTVVKPEVSSIKVETYPASQAYRPGSTYVSAGLVLRVTYVDGIDELVYTGYTVNAPILQEGNNTITVSYGGKSVSYTVTVTSETAPVDQGGGLGVGAIVGISVGCVAVVAAAAVVTVLMIRKKKNS